MYNVTPRIPATITVDDGFVLSSTDRGTRRTSGRTYVHTCVSRVAVAFNDERKRLKEEELNGGALAEKRPCIVAQFIRFIYSASFYFEGRDKEEPATAVHREFPVTKFKNASLSQDSLALLLAVPQLLRSLKYGGTFKPAKNTRNDHRIPTFTAIRLLSFSHRKKSNLF